MSVRDQIVEVARWGVRMRARIHYAEARPMPLRRTLPLTTDCSGFATLCYFLAGAPDPNGLDYDGEGYTGTLLLHLPHVGAADAQAGDIVVWGRYPGRHCAVVLEPGDDPLLASHGAESGPLELRFSVEQRAQPGQPATWLDGLPSLDLAPRDPWVRPGSDPGVGAGDANPP
jgi:hypothetical protein